MSNKQLPYHTKSVNTYNDCNSDKKICSIHFNGLRECENVYIFTLSRTISYRKCAELNFKIAEYLWTMQNIYLSQSGCK